MIYFTLFYEFLKTGLFAIGGGLATLPFLQNIQDKYGWITDGQFIDMIAISESTPGPIGINMATYMGYNAAGYPGAIIATIGEVTPSVIVIILIAHYFMKYNEHPVVRAGFYGLRPAVTALIASAGFEVAKITLFNLSKYMDTRVIMDLLNLKSIALFLALLFLTNKYQKHPIVYIIGAAAVGVILKY